MPPREERMHGSRKFGSLYAITKVWKRKEADDLPNICEIGPTLVPDEPDRSHISAASLKIADCS